MNKELEYLEQKYSQLNDGKPGGVLWEGEVFNLATRIIFLHNSIPDNTIRVRPKAKYLSTQPFKKVKKASK